MRKTEFVNGEFYHIYNRGVDKRDVFMDEDDYKRFILNMNLLNDENNGLMQLYRDYQREKVRPSDPRRSNLGVFENNFKEQLKSRNKLVEFVAYCLNPNHYHFILKQNADKGVERFMQKLGTSYTMYFNKKHKRSGSLFQGKFKSIHIDSNEYLLYLSAYVNQNHFIHGGKNKNWKYSSLLDYLGKRNGMLCDKDVILEQFDYDLKDYKDFIEKMPCI